LRDASEFNAASSPQELDNSLDPENWDELRELGHRMIDDLFDDLRSLRDQPVWKPVPDNVRAQLSGDTPPLEPQGARAAYDDYRRLIAPYPRGNVHPRFWGWVNGSNLPMGILGDLLASALNPSVSSFENSANLVEEQVLHWLKHLLGFPDTYSALLTSGSSMSNVIALAVARNATLPFDVRREGLAASNQRLAMYCSSETHSSIRKAVELLGMGNDTLRSIPVTAEYRIDLGALRKAIAHDRQAGIYPLCVIGNVGTVNTGAIDNLDHLSDLCAQEKLWLHVDGAFGALAWLCPEMRPILGPLQRADSLAFDLHKWMYLPYDVGCVFVADASAHRDTFSVAVSYLATISSLHDGIVTSFPDYGIELSRRFRALKVWLCLKEHGARRFEQQIRQNISQAHYLAKRIQARDQLELMAPVSLNVVCFRYVSPHLGSEATNALNIDLLNRLQRGGLVFASSTVLQGQNVLRVAITNHRSQQADFDLLVREVIRLGSELAAEFTSAMLEGDSEVPRTDGMSRRKDGHT
jgi:aromatic-L-amino-acid decarboxylase